MKKGRIVGAVIVLYCTVVFGIFLGKTGFFGTATHTSIGGNEITTEDTTNTETNIGMIEGQHLNFTSDINTDILSRHALPSLERMEKKDQEEYVNNLQVMKKIELLGIGKRDFLYPELKMSDIGKKIDVLNDIFNEDKEKIIFSGTTSEELQKVIDNNPNTIIELDTKQIELHNTIYLKDNTIINGNGTKFFADNIRYGFTGESISNVFINNINIQGNIEYGMYFVDCTNIKVANSKINGMLQKSICIIGTTTGFSITNNEMCNNQAGGIYIAGNVSNGIIELNDIRNNGGTSNWMAGIVITNVLSNDKYNIWETFDEAHHFPYKENLYAQLNCPNQLIIRDNQVMYNNASGIYSDGAYLCYILNNTVYQNDKEGICLDYGTIGFYLKENVFKANGRRIRQSDEDLRMDFVLDAGRMDDSSAKSKLPGVSLDNTAYNILENNIVVNNYGGGIKMVRTTVRTLVMENIIRDNNMGQNDNFHFFGIELGAAPAGSESIAMDFTSDFENIICRNSITGNHYSGVFIGEGCYVNDVFDNVIMEPQMFAIEAISKKFNSIINNISNMEIRNENLGE